MRQTAADATALIQTYVQHRFKLSPASNDDVTYQGTLS
jgi:hypothetical protein